MSGEAGSGQTADGSKGRWPTLRWGLASAILLWLALPPVGWWPLAWVGPIGWLLIASREERLDRGDWWRVYVSGVVYWALACHWICLPHPATPVGWVFLSLYLGLYPTAFVWLTRVATNLPSPWWGGAGGGGRPRAPTSSTPPLTPPDQGEGDTQKRLGIPLWLAAPIVWVGMECLQARLFSGFLMGAVSHAVATFSCAPFLPQTFGERFTSFVVVLVASLASVIVCAVLPTRRTTRRWATALGGILACVSTAAILALVVGQGAASFALERTTRQLQVDHSLTVGVIQGNTLATWDHDFNERNREVMDRQSALSVEAVERAAAEGKTLDLVIWPESMFRAPLDTFGGKLTPPEWADDGLLLRRRNLDDWFRSLTAKLGTPLIVGLDRFDWRVDPQDPDTPATAKVYNTAALVGRSGELVAFYDKTHLVPFGEYIPLMSGVPALYFLTPVGAGMAAGDGPVPFVLETSDGRQVTIAPSICFETAVPRVIRRQVAELTDAGTPPDLLVNITNDAWFWGSAELDIHLACAQYRAAETGTPVVVAANGGLSAAIDARGRVFEVSPRMEEHVLIADIPLRRDGPPTTYVCYGDWFALGCLALCGVVAILGVLPKNRTTDEHG